MPVVLLATELGGGLGHVKRLLAFAEILEKKGHRPVFAVPDVVTAAAGLGDKRFPVWQGVVWPGRFFPKKPTRSFADILADKGFAHSETLKPMLAGWSHLLDVVKPAAVIADHTPSLCLAVQGRVPLIVVGNGFTVPPANGTEFPPLRTDVRETMPQSRILGVIQAVQQDMGLAPIKKLTGIFPSDDSYALVYPECDPYRRARLKPAVGPLEPPDTGLPTKPEGPLYAYLSAGYPKFSALLNGLMAHKIPTHLFVRDATGEQKKKIRSAGFHIYDQPPPLAKVLAKSSAFLHHGGVGSMMAAMAAGRPQICLPTHLEQRLSADALQDIGAGVSLPGKPTAENILKAVVGVGRTQKFSTAAMDLAHDLLRRGYGDNQQTIVEHCCDLIGAA